MTRRYRYETTLDFGAGEGKNDYVEFDIRVTHTVAWGSPETGVGYMADPLKYDPGSPDVVEDVRVETIEGKPRPWNLLGFSDDDLARVIVERLKAAHDDMARAAAQTRQDEKDAALESRAEERREELRRT
jgi:hypothetical protein